MRRLLTANLISVILPTESATAPSHVCVLCPFQCVEIVMHWNLCKLMVTVNYQRLEHDALGASQRPRLATLGARHTLIDRGLRTAIRFCILVNTQVERQMQNIR
ncbi:hypothetical protein WS71_22455 [Burkholderia mayonis]|uniref:Uncharacterized protein n=1 Tax=Burkholderia mayonis TaxID=1385591 RepID=A0A1B4G268_9BURK|nr:hypothetical protein WS71_22455 [Burkholderia mayonis]KVE49055.1 hypothetical protein WS71_17375 [Burkholderia mayonis]